MSVKVEKLDHSMVKLTIEAPAEKLDAAIGEAYKKNKYNFNVPGFRKGKVPQKMIEKMYGPGVFYEDAANIVLQESYPEAVDESGEKVVARPEIDIVQVEKGKPFIYTAEVAVKPPVELGKYEGVEVEEQKPEPVTEADIIAELDKQREKNARVISRDDRAIEKGDTAVIDFIGSIDGEEFAGGKGENHPLEIGSGAFIPGFEDQLIGKKAGEHADVKVTFPEDYQAEDLAGKDAVFAVDIKEVKVKELPELDDDFAQDISEFDTLDELKENVKAKLTDERRDECERRMRDIAIAKVIDAAKIDIPDKMIEFQAESMVNQAAQSLAQQGISMEQYAKVTGATYDTMIEQFRPESEVRVRRELVLEAVADAEKLEVTDEDIEAEVKRTADMYGMETEQLLKYIDEDGRERMKDDLRLDKAVQFIGDKMKPVKLKKSAAKKTTKKADAKAEDEKKDAGVSEDAGKKPAAKKPAVKKAAKKTDGETETAKKAGSAEEEK